MNIHKNPRLTPHGRAELSRRVVEGSQLIAEVADAYGTVVGRTERSLQPSANPLIYRRKRLLPGSIKKAAGGVSGRFFENWLPGPDSNQRPSG